MKILTKNHEHHNINRNLVRKTTILLRLVVCVTVFALYTACEKEDIEVEQAVEITYKIDPLDNNFTMIVYTDPFGQQVELTDITQFDGGEKKISVTSKPFSAKLQVHVSNLSNSPKHYILLIAANNEIKKVQELNVPAQFTAMNATIEYVID